MDEKTLQEAIANPQNLGELADADAVGTVGSPDCGDMVRMWIKYKEQDGRKVIDKASFQSFGCQTAIAVASMATQLIKGKTREEVLNMSAAELSEPLGPFCCNRCKLVDLGKWLGEEYRVSEPLRPDHFAEFDPDQPINRAQPDDEYTS